MRHNTNNRSATSAIGISMKEWVRPGGGSGGGDCSAPSVWPPRLTQLMNRIPVLNSPAGGADLCGDSSSLLPGLTEPADAALSAHLAFQFDTAFVSSTTVQQGVQITVLDSFIRVRVRTPAAVHMPGFPLFPPSKFKLKRIDDRTS